VKPVNKIISVLVLFFIIFSTYSCSEEEKDDSTATPTTPVTETPETKTLSQNIIDELKTNLQTSSSSLKISEVKRNTSIVGGALYATSTSLTDSQIDSIIENALKSVTDAGLSNSEDLILIMPLIVKGAEHSLSNIQISTDTEKMSTIQVIVSSVIKSLKGRDEFLIESSKEGTLTTKQTLLKVVSESAIGSMDEAGISKANIAESSKLFVGSIVGNLDEAGLTANDLKGAVSAITSGAVEALDDITLDGYDCEYLDEMIKEITAGATGALDDIIMDDYNSDNLGELVKCSIPQ